MGHRDFSKTIFTIINEPILEIGQGICSNFFKIRFSFVDHHAGMKFVRNLSAKKKKFFWVLLQQFPKFNLCIAQKLSANKK